ncbi:hypothetical protein NL676_031037 [Syzygium grande]|nr:hypothetical protein NL676_031037 [Syzygium grande]
MRTNRNSDMQYLAGGEPRREAVLTSTFRPSREAAGGVALGGDVSGLLRRTNARLFSHFRVTSEAKASLQPEREKGLWDCDFGTRGEPRRRRRRRRRSRRRPVMAVETDASAPPGLALADTDINWDRLDKMRFHIIGAVLLTAQSALLHPAAVVKTRMQVAGSGMSQMRGMVVFKHILRNDGVPGAYRGFGTSAVGSLPGRVLALTSLEVSKDTTLKYMERFDMPEATRVGVANGVAGMLSNLVSCVYYVPLDVICQRLMVQGLPGTASCNGPFDVVRKVMKVEGVRGLYRGFGLTALTQSPASALWWGAYGAAQHIIWRSLGYKDEMEKPSHAEMVTVQATAGLLAGACSSIITTPVDTVKTRLQVMDNFSGGRPSVLNTTKTLLKEDGWWGFYRGFGPRFLSMSLYGTTMIVTYELIKRLSLKQD